MNYCCTTYNGFIPGIIFVLLSGLGLPLHCQNLVPNPDFDEFRICPVARGQIGYAEPWYSPNGKTTDFAHICAGTGYAGIPSNEWGMETPFAGRGYAGLRTWGNFSGSDPYREYLAVELLDSLVAGEIYRVNFRISLGDSARYTTDDIALHFSRDSIPNLDLLELSPHISNNPGNVINNPYGWHLISGEYLARGGERHLVIGNFLDDEHTTLQSRGLADGIGANSTYFYIDHVVVEPCAENFPEHLILATDSLLCPGETLELLAQGPPLAKFTWSNGSTDTLLQVSQTGRVILTADVRGCYKVDSIEIKEAPALDFDLGADTTLCPGETIQIGVKDSVDQFRWNDRFQTLQRNIDTAGIYTLELALGNCLFTDAIQISYEPGYEQALPKDTVICETAPAILLASYEGAQYQWSDFSTEMSLQTSQSGQHWVDIETNCFAAREYFNVSTEDCGCESFIPNVFTPNGDGIQEQFQLEFTEGISNYSLDIFDRYGRLIFRTSNPTEFWDGNNKGKQVPEGVYYWAAQYRCYAAEGFKQNVRKGYVSVLR